MDNITIDRVIWWHGADAATGDTTRAHLMGYDVVTTAGSTSGDLSNGVVLADGADVTFTFDNSTAYRYWRFDKTGGNGSNNLNIYEIEMYEKT